MSKRKQSKRMEHTNAKRKTKNPNQDATISKRKSRRTKRNSGSGKKKKRADRKYWESKARKRARPARYSTATLSAGNSSNDIIPGKKYKIKKKTKQINAEVPSHDLFIEIAIQVSRYLGLKQKPKKIPKRAFIKVVFMDNDGNQNFSNTPRQNFYSSLDVEDTVLLFERQFNNDKRYFEAIIIGYEVEEVTYIEKNGLQDGEVFKRSKTSKKKRKKTKR